MDGLMTGSGGGPGDPYGSPPGDQILNPGYGRIELTGDDATETSEGFRDVPPVIFEAILSKRLKEGYFNGTLRKGLFFDAGSGDTMNINDFIRDNSTDYLTAIGR